MSPSCAPAARTAPPSRPPSSIPSNSRTATRPCSWEADISSANQSKPSAPTTPLPRVDVVIPCYRYGRFLADCLSSVLSQQNAQTRCLIIDDCSGDGSAEIAAEFARTDSRIEVLVHPVNRGHITTYNEGIEWSSGDYFLLLSADDMVLPGAFARSISIMEMFPNIVLTHGREINYFVGDLPPAPPTPQRIDGPWQIESGENFIAGLCHATMNMVCTSTAIVRAAAQKSIGGYRKELPHSGDLEMWLRLATLGDVATTTAWQGVRRFHTTNMSAVQFGTALADFRQVRTAFDMFFANEGRGLRDGPALANMARERLAERFFWQGLAITRRTRSLDGIQVAGAALKSAPSALLGILDRMACYIEPDLQQPLMIQNRN